MLHRQGGRQSPLAYVDRIEKGSPAAALELRPDDLIVRIGEFPIRDCKEFDETLLQFAPGQKALLTWKRGEKVMQGEIELIEDAPR